MLEKTVGRLRRREWRFYVFLAAALSFDFLAVLMQVIAVVFEQWVKSCSVFTKISLVLFCLGTLFSGIAGIQSNHFWGMAEGMILSEEEREKLLRMCGDLE